MREPALFCFICAVLLLGAGCATTRQGGEEPLAQAIPAAGGDEGGSAGGAEDGEQPFVKEDESLFQEDRGAIEIIGSGENGRVLHKDVVYQGARPGDYITVFNGRKLDSPRILTQGDIDWSISQYKGIAEELRDTSPGSVRDLLDTLIDVSGSVRDLLDALIDVSDLDSADIGSASAIEPVDLSQIRGKGVKEFISDVRDGVQRILIVMDPEHSAWFDEYYTTPPWKKETASEGGDYVLMLAKRVNSDANEIFSLNEDIQVTKTLIKKIIEVAPPPPPPPSPPPPPPPPPPVSKPFFDSTLGFYFDIGLGIGAATIEIDGIDVGDIFGKEYDDEINGFDFNLKAGYGGLKRDFPLYFVGELAFMYHLASGSRYYPYYPYPYYEENHFDYTSFFIGPGVVFYPLSFIQLAGSIGASFVSYQIDTTVNYVRHKNAVGGDGGGIAWDISAAIDFGILNLGKLWDYTNLWSSTFLQPSEEPWFLRNHGLLFGVRYFGSLNSLNDFNESLYLSRWSVFLNYAYRRKR